MKTPSVSWETNGAGKTTLLNAVSGLIPPASGRIRFDGSDITRQAGYRIARRGLSHVPERRDLFPDMTVAENLMMGAYGRSDGDSGSDLHKVLDYFPKR